MNNSLLIANVLTLLQPFSPNLKSLPTDIQFISRTESQGELHLKNQFLNLAHIGELRIASIESAKIEIIMLLFFPNAEIELPIYAADFVTLSTKPIVAVIDVHYLIDSVFNPLVLQLLRDAKQDLGELIDSEKPDWYLQSCSGEDIFIRYPNLSQMQELKRRYLQIWQGLIPLFDSASRLNNKDLILYHQQQLQHYKIQHQQHSPSLPLLNRCFGKTWTNDYLSNYLFA
ncbi:MAG: hypothetical protein RL637_957 [Pseudomonadota bacterium]|jgi:hypothetical protein